MGTFQPSVRELDVEQALLAVLAACRQMGLQPEDLRLIAVGGLVAKSSWTWVDPKRIPGATAALETAVHRLQEDNQASPAAPQLYLGGG